MTRYSSGTGVPGHPRHPSRDRGQGHTPLIRGVPSRHVVPRGEQIESTFEANPEGTADWDTCPACGGDWLKCGCDPEEADAAYTPGDAA